MSNLTPTFVRKEGMVYAIFEDRVIAKGNDFNKVEESAVDYLKGLGVERDSKEKESRHASATHIVTPNGLKGEVLGRVEGIWGEKESTVRFENGRIAKFQAHAGNDDQIEYINDTRDTPSNPIEALQAELDADFGRDKSALTARIASLDSIITEVAGHISKGASYTDMQALSKLALTAEHEKGEIRDALSYLEQADAEVLGYQPPVFSAVEQADLGRAKGDSWLDATVAAMQEENAGIDYDKLLAEEPGQFVASLETGTLASQGIVSELAYSHIASKTAAFIGKEVDSYRDLFVAAVEQSRRAELAIRQDVAKKEASAKEESLAEIPDESLFL